MVTFIPFQIKAENTADNILIEHGVPLEIINKMTELQKEYLRDNLPKDAVYESFAEKEYVFDEKGIPTIQPYSPLPSSDLTMSVVGFTNGNGTYNIYPSFVWHNFSKTPSNDVFTVELYPGWKLTPGTRPNCRLWNKNSDNKLTAYYDYPPEAMGAIGAAFHFGKDLVSSAGFEGHASLTATKKLANATHSVVLNYFHDTSLAFSVSFSISVGAAQITIVPSKSSSVDTMNGIFPF